MAISPRSIGVGLAGIVAVIGAVYAYQTWTGQKKAGCGRATPSQSAAWAVSAGAPSEGRAFGALNSTTQDTGAGVGGGQD